MKMPRFRPVWAAAAQAASGLAHAAGGHHAIDDAAILDPGQCQVETWVDRHAANDRGLAHVGSACRLGRVELGLNLDRTRARAENDVSATGVQAKWSRPLTDSLSVGLVLGATWQDRAPGFAGGTVVVPLTWQPHEQWMVHVNVGRDFLNGSADKDRGGAAVEWAPTPAWSFVAERFLENNGQFWRLGGRWQLNSSVNIDLSHARSLRGDGPRWWTLGANWVFSR
ncbi:hypothetical protein GCM10028796_13080 [Ramlibacter monticola]|uniref:Transporter n=1 Tax=Ramlibacter monticola TaxID=1926872 RepID=A0A937CS36_9BURK|nr:hypothetical protein [Ramlibacter monticola]MBL0390154.1 hypothetical protein [Ramlibacter monticola]